MTALKLVKKQIKDYKDRLIRKSEQAGIWENFGQEEVRLLEGVWESHQYAKEDGVWSEIEQFNQWCMNYTGE